MSVSYEHLTVITDERGLVLELLPAEDFVSQRNAHIVVSFPVLLGATIIIQKAGKR